MLGLLFAVYQMFEIRAAAEASNMSDRPKAVSAAIVTFADTYGYLPGDLPKDKIGVLSCNDCESGDGDGVISWQAKENVLMWQHLIAAGLAVTGQQGGFFNGSAYKLDIVYFDENHSLPFALAKPKKEGHYLFYAKTDATDFDKDALLFLEPLQAQRLDMKLDDGFPDTGNAIAAGNDECLTKDEHGKLIYNEAINNRCLSLYIYVGYPIGKEKK